MSIFPHFVIIGAGISGLTLAWNLRKKHGKSARITLLEKEARVGGWIRTIEKEGFLFEQGPRGCRFEGAESLLQLVHELQLQDQLIGSDASAKVRYLYWKKELKALPQSIGGLFLSPWLLKVITKALLRDAFQAKSKEDRDETIDDFITRRLGSDIADLLVDPLVSGIYAGDIKALSLKSCFPLLYQWEQESGSLLRGAWEMVREKRARLASKLEEELKEASLFSFKGGMESFVICLARRLDAAIELQTEVIGLTIERDGILVHSSKGFFAADHLFSTVSAEVFAPWVSVWNSSLAALLGSIKSSSLIVVNVGYRKAVLKKKGYGYLVPTKEGEEILGAVWDSSLFPQHNRHREETRLTLMMGGERHPQLLSLSDEAIAKKALGALSCHLNIDAVPDALFIGRKTSAIPQYTCGYADKVAQIQQLLPSQLTLLGTSFCGVSINGLVHHTEIRNAKYVKH